MHGQPDFLSSGPRESPRWRVPWPGSARGRRLAIAAAGTLLACLAVALGSLAVVVAHRDDTINDLRVSLRPSRDREPSAAAGPALPVGSGSAFVAFPDSSGGSFSMVAADIRPRPGAAPLLWLYIHGQHATPGGRYALLGGTCGGQYVTPNDWAEATADGQGDLTIVAPNLLFSGQDRQLWVLVYRMADGITLGGIQGPFIGGGATAFRSSPPC